MMTASVIQPSIVIPAKAGIFFFGGARSKQIPAFAGMTIETRQIVNAAESLSIVSRDTIHRSAYYSNFASIKLTVYDASRNTSSSSHRSSAAANLCAADASAALDALNVFASRA